MGNFFRSFIRASSFLRKEIFEVLRQPQLIATLVLGPFIILLIFGVGYRNETPILRTLFVAQPDSPFAVEVIQQSEKTLSKLFAFAGTVADQGEALSQLRAGKVDIVIVVPVDAMATIKNNKQALFTFYYKAIDPVQVSYIKYMGWLYVGAINKQVLLTLAAQGQKDTANLHTSLQAAHQNLAALSQAIQNGDETLAQQEQQGLTANLDVVSQAAGASLGLLGGLQQMSGTNANSPDVLQSTLSDLQQNTSQLDDSTATPQARLARLDSIDQDLIALDTMLAEFQSIDPFIIISPFLSEMKSIANDQLTTSDFFAPAVLALLLQHLAVTFAALSIVRERNVGTMELFRVSPLSAAEVLFGKYISYLLFGGVVAAILSALLVFGLHVPMLGNWWYFALVIVVVLFASLGIGFAISIVSQTDSQAVQYSMIVLLASVFFSGFIMSLDMLLAPVRVISWLLPTTYGALLLRNISLSGSDPNWLLLGGLAGIGLVLMLISWGLMRRLMASPK